MATDPPENLVGETVDGRWQLVAPLGAGGMGVVYRAERVKLGRAVAIKFLDERAAASEQAVARFDREARAISRLRHRHVVDILDFGVWRRRPYIVMEYVPGRPLNKDMGKPGMTPARAVRIMRQILEALRHAHQSGVVHRDLKPENVMLAESTGDSDYVKLLDFGLALIIGDAQPSISAPRTIAGTPSYMSPEQARGERPDHRTDIYSCGVMLFGMCTGQKPFKADDPMELLRMHLHAPPPSPRKIAPEKKISVELERVILRALEKERDKRYYHAGEFLAALERVPEMRAATGKRSRGRLAAAALLLAALGGGGYAWRARLHRRAAIARSVPSSSAAPSTGPSSGEANAKPPPTPAPPPPPAQSPTVTAAIPAAQAAAATARAESPADLAHAPANDLATPPVADAAVPPPPATTTATATRAPTTTPTMTPAATPAPARAAQPPPVVTPAPTAPAPSAPPSTREQVARLLDADQLAEAERLLRAQAILEPRAGWVHLQLGEIYFRKLWRRDAEKEWDLALALDPSLRSDARLGERLCTALGPTWKGTAQRLVVRHLGADAVAPLTECMRRADSLERLHAAARLVERVAPRRLDRDLVAARTQELARKR